MDLILEIISVVLNLIFLVLLLKEKKICWAFGILGSITSIYLFYLTKLYSECILYIYYVFMGFYGYYLWNKGENTLKISKWGFANHIYILFLGFILSTSLGYYFDNYTSAEKSYLDAHTTIFSFIATYLEAKKVLSTWIFWIVLNGLSVYLYFTKGLNIYALLALAYFVISFYGYLEWRRKYNLLDYSSSLIS